MLIVRNINIQVFTAAQMELTLSQSMPVKNKTADTTLRVIKLTNLPVANDTPCFDEYENKNIS